jgi:hypothetical protein
MRCLTTWVVGPFLTATLGGCATAENLCPDHAGDPVRVYGGVRTDVERIARYPEYYLPFVTETVVALDAVGDTLTLLYVLGRQGYEWAKSRRADPAPARSEEADR